MVGDGVGDTKNALFRQLCSEPSKHGNLYGKVWMVCLPPSSCKSRHACRVSEVGIRMTSENLGGSIK